ncbi:MAG TPA: hypothetical protein VMZ52_18880, partial [Bryobacteraceae bacterium]|nr:hypothetical protein [Bryobacteraceae bacterium]
MKLQPDYGVASTNNGNVMSQSIAVSGTAFTASQSYTYDAWNRLETVAEGTNWKQKFGYDRWGNRWIDQTLTSGIAVAPGTPIGSEWYNSGNNQMLVSHDLAGNASPMPGRIYKYDVENRIVSVDGGTAALNESFAYDGEGRRVKRTVNGVASLYVYDAMGQLAQEYGNVSAAGRSYLFTDHLGSTRMQ